MSIPKIPAAPLAAAMAAAWPGLPAGMTLEEAERCTRKAIQAAYPHLVDAQDEVIADATEAAARRIEDYAEHPSCGSAERQLLMEAARIARGQTPRSELAFAMFGRPRVD